MEDFSTTISELDHQIILKVKELREAKGLSQRDLSEKMNLSKSFVGKVEALGQPDKYSIRHLSLIAKALGLVSFKDIMPSVIPEHDMIEIRYHKVPKLSANGSEKKQLEDRIVSVKPI